MNNSDLNWQAEQERVDEVVEQIGQEIHRLEIRTGEVRNDVVDIRQNFWDEVTINFSNAEDLTETYFSMKQQTDILSERERSHRHASQTLAKYRRLVQSPYFGRIDFREHGSSHTETIYLGIASFMDEQSEAFLIYDWRAPVSSLYYDYGPGEVEYNTPAGVIEGQMALKRQFVIRNGQIELLFDTGLTIGDELLQQALSKSADAQMRSIVATIQKEQNQIIRDERSRMLIVQGAAGSGKTSAALQRVAYLLYKNRETLQADQMVLFSPNPLFNSYVSTVLPELGEENMVQTTFQEYLESRLSKQFLVEDSFTQLDRLLTAENSEEMETLRASIRFKSSSDYMSILLGYTKWLETSGMKFHPIQFRDETIVTGEAIADYFYQLDSGIKLANRIVLVRDWLLLQLVAYEKQQRKAAWAEEEIELLSPSDYQRVYQKMRKHRRKHKDETFDDFDKEQALLVKALVRERLKRVRNSISGLVFVDAAGLYRQLFEQDGTLVHELANLTLPEQWVAICSLTINKLDSAQLSYEDATPYLYLVELLLGFQTNNNVRHVIIDEAQDYSLFQLEFIKRLFPRSRMTALGDFNQAIYVHTSALGEAAALSTLYGEEQTGLIRLTRSYRSTRQIVEFTRGIVPGGQFIIPFNRDGELPKVHQLTDKGQLDREIAAEVDRLKEQGYDSIAIICKTVAESELAYAALRQNIELQLIGKDTAAFSIGVQVIPAYLAKGVEFDAVIIYNGSQEQYGREMERKLFYTACTRAMHDLRIYSIGKASEFVTKLDRSTYEVVDH
ncbi:helicase [Paenibacillaceae bacterium]|nr:helicase [Paenibacillaceae bacterium]